MHKSIGLNVGALSRKEFGLKKTLRLVLVDDEQELREALGFELTHAGFEVIQVDNGKDAYDMCLKENIDCLISDISMPKWDGFRLLKKLRKAGRSELPVIFMTAHASHEFEGSTDLENLDVLSKPFEAEVLIHKIKRLLEHLEDED